jgi:predicted phosphate transport protein (TIGR00153 family)
VAKLLKNRLLFRFFHWFLFKQKSCFKPFGVLAACMNRLVSFFLPKETEFFVLLEKQSSTILKASKEFHDFVKGFSSLDEQQRARFIRRIGKLESLGDQQSQEIVDLLHKSLVTPYDREDIHELTVRLDDVIDLLDSTTRKLLLYKVRRIPHSMLKQADLVQEMTKTLHAAMRDLNHLEKLKPHCDSLLAIEHRGDVLYEDSLSRLFDGFETNGETVLDVIKFRDLHGQLENIFDTGKRLAETIRTIVVKHG